MEELLKKFEIKIIEEFRKKGFSWIIGLISLGFIVLYALLKLFFSKDEVALKREKINTLDKFSTKILFSDILNSKSFGWMLLLLSFTLMFIEVFLKIDALIGGWNIILYLLILFPLIYLALTNKLNNPYTKWFLPLLFLMIFDMFYYNNSFVINVLPIIFYLIVTILYVTSTHNVHSFYQTLFPKFNWIFNVLHNLIPFLENLLIRKSDNKIYRRIALALLITLPFFGVFIALLFSADVNFSNFLKAIIDINFSFNSNYLITVPLYFLAYLLFFLYTLSNFYQRKTVKESSALDILIVGIFLGMINLLFITFITIQLPFLLGANYLPEGVNVAEFAREGFFQLMMVMAMVLFIFLFIMRRFKGEKIIIFLLSSLLIETIVMGILSLKKMYLYQSLKGVTVMRYYVEWFDYFLLLVLFFGIWFLLRKLNFYRLLNLTVVLSILSFATIISLNVDGMVAQHNIFKFKNSMKELDTNALQNLSIDALPNILDNGIILENNQTVEWYIEPKRLGCKDFAHYHLGYCSKI